MPESAISPKLLNHLRYAKTMHGKIGARVKATGDHPDNLAWITVLMHKGADFTGSFPKEFFISYEIEYLELRADYVEELHGLDWDEFMVRTEKYHNIKEVAELERLLGKWLDDLGDLQPAGNIQHPAW